MLPDTGSVLDTNALAMTLFTYSMVAECLQYVCINHDQQQQVLEWLLHPLYDKVCRAAHLMSQQEDHAAADAKSAAAVQVQTAMNIWMLATKFYFADGKVGLDYSCHMTISF